MSDLLPCPFCGSEPEFDGYDEEDSNGEYSGTCYSIRCRNNDCDVQPDVYSGGYPDTGGIDLEKIWNTRYIVSNEIVQ
jgi:hypothetical protein